MFGTEYDEINVTNECSFTLTTGELDKVAINETLNECSCTLTVGELERMINVNRDLSELNVSCLLKR